MQDVRRFLWMVGLALLWPSTAVGGSCSEFPWYHPRDMVMPDILHNGQQAMGAGELLEARELFSTYLFDHDEGVFADGAKWVVASLPDVSDEPGTEFLKQIERLQSMKAEHPDSVYAPWALCSIGQLYWDAGWHSEANAVFEEFLSAYPDHPMAGGVMVEAGLGYLKNRQFLEAALILRRVVAEPKWEKFRLRGALGLADATAMSKAWKQAYYWYRVVEAESPELIRQSELSSYFFGLTELAVGESRKAIPRFLTTFNSHPKQDIAGEALNRISETLLTNGHEYFSLWFAEQAKRRFKGKEPGRRGQAAQIRWIVKYLDKGYSQEDLTKVYKRLGDLDVYLSVSWDNVVETSRLLRHAPEQDIVEESLVWLGRGYRILNDIPAALDSFKHLVVVATVEKWKQEGQRGLSDILNGKIHALYDQQAWVSLLKFHEDQREAFDLIPLTRERVKSVAQAYQKINLPIKAMRWYDQLLEDYPESPLREEIFAQKVLLAESQGNGQLVRETGEKYVREYPQGQWRAEVLTVMGMESMKKKDYPKAIQHLSDALPHVRKKTLERYVLGNRAIAYQEAGTMDLALQDLKKVVALNPLDMGNLVRLGDFLFGQGDYSDAELRYEQVLASKAPEALKAWAKYRWGLALDYQGKSKQSQKLLSEFRGLETQSPEFENTIRAAAVAVLDEFSLKEMSQSRSINEGS